MLRFVIYIFTMSIILYECLSQKNLRNVQCVFRHGARSPIEPIKHDTHANAWPEGLGQLTDFGIVNQFNLGQWLRKRYTSFIPYNYNASYYYMRSTDMDRTIMSALSNMAGFYKNDTSPLFKYNLKWRPIPVHSTSQETDILFSMADCPRMQHREEELLISDAAKDFFNQYQPFFETLRNWTGKQDIDIHNVWSVLDDLICSQVHNRTLPSWYTHAVRTNLTNVVNYIWKLNNNDVELLRLLTGPFLNEAILKMRVVMNPNHKHSIQPTPMMAYSAHDTNVAALLGAIGSFKNTPPPGFAACFIMELIGPVPPSKSSEYFIRIFYKPNWKEKGTYLKLNNCQYDPSFNGCTFDSFVKSVEHLLLKNDEYALVCTINVYKNVKFLIISVSIFMFTLCVIVFISVYLALFRQRRRQFEYLY